VQSHQGPKKDNGVTPVRGSTKQSMNRWLPRFGSHIHRALASRLRTRLSISRIRNRDLPPPIVNASRRAPRAGRRRPSSPLAVLLARLSLNQPCREQRCCEAGAAVNPQLSARLCLQRGYRRDRIARRTVVGSHVPSEIVLVTRYFGASSSASPESIGGVLVRGTRPLTDAVERDELDDRNLHDVSPPSTRVARAAVTEPHPSKKPRFS
jgi:hypothetical protein